MGKKYSESIDWGQSKGYQTKESPSGGGTQGSTETYEKCAHTHPILKLGKHSITGGACSTPQKGPYDIEIALDYSGGKRVYPWDGKVYVHFPIPDMDIPSDVEGFKKMIMWTAEQIIKGKKVHVGCIGGHGRTGMFLVALYAYMFPLSADGAIAHVRKHYCKKAVETDKQVKFLMKEYGVGKAKGYKQDFAPPPVHKPSKGIQYLYDDSTTIDDWWNGKQAQLFQKEQGGKARGGSPSPRNTYAGYGARFNQDVPQELRVIEPVAKKGRLLAEDFEIDTALLGYEADY